MEHLREFAPADRYVYDWNLCSAKNGFAQVDTSSDASYFGTWANPFKLVIFNYCEGDCCTTVCENEQEFTEELNRIKEWHDSNDTRGFLGIDCLCNKEIEQRFDELGLSELLH